MEEKKVVKSARAPQPKGPYSQAVAHNGLLYVSGQGHIDASTGEIIKGTIEEETRAVLESIKGIVGDAGGSMTSVLKVTCFLKDMNDFPRFNQVYASYFSQAPPARTTVQAARLPLDMDLEIDVIAALPKSV